MKEVARLILAFTGNPELPGFNTLEAIEYNDEQARFSIYAADLSRDRIFGKNPRACMGCHGSDPRPIWDTSPIWPGTYGSLGDRIRRNSDEAHDYRVFLNRAGRAEIYRHLHLDSRGFKNGKFTTLLARLNSERMARQLAEIPWLRRKSFARFHDF